MKDLGYYHDLYLKTNVLLLSNVFKTFRTTCLEHYTLDPAHVYRLATCPGHPGNVLGYYFVLEMS